MLEIAADLKMSAGAKITLSVPDIAKMPDEEIAALARSRDGRWSLQTKSMLERSGTDLLDLNPGWASTWTGWSCPCCKREKQQIARVSQGKVLLCRLELHHDHLDDRIKSIFDTLNPRVEGDVAFNQQISDAKFGLAMLAVRFEPALICIDCNLADGEVKTRLAGRIDSDFSFSPVEISKFIRVTPNRKHEVNLDRAIELYGAAESDFRDRLAFAQLVAKRFSHGRHRREALSRSHQSTFEDRDYLWQQAADAMPSLRDNSLSRQLATRSVANDSAFNSPRPARSKRAGQGPSQAEFKTLVEKMDTGRRTWDAAGDDWKCPCCNRSKYEICRKSNRGVWSAQIHWVREWTLEDDEDSLAYRLHNSEGAIVIGAYSTIFICGDCRSIITKTQQREKGRFTEECLVCEDISSVIGTPLPHTQHELNLDLAVERAVGNLPLMRAISEFSAHSERARALAGRLSRMVRFERYDEKTAKTQLVLEMIDDHGTDWDDAEEYLQWLIDEGQRLYHLDARQRSIREGVDESRGL